MSRRVVVTGIGLISPLGITAKASWDSILKGKSGISRISKFDVSRSTCRVAGQISSDDFKPEDFIEPKDLRKMDLFIQYGLIATAEAVADSGWKPTSNFECERTGVMIGSGIGGLKTIEDTSIQLSQSNNGKVSPFFIPASLVNLLSGHAAIKYDFRGPNHAVTTACSTGAHAIGDAARIIKYGDADVMIAGGAEAPITPVGLAGFASARALSTSYNDTPELASRPWDKGHDGFVMGEGAGIVVLEEYEHAKARGAKIYAEVVGYGMAGDAYHITSPHPDGRGALASMKNALRDARINPEQVSYINAHGTSTEVGDAIELGAVQNIFLEANPNIKMSSTKSSIGHLLGAAGSAEFIFSVLAIRDQIVPATLNLHDPIEGVKIDLVPLTPKEAKVEYVLSNSFGFGGTNASLLVRSL